MQVRVVRLVEKEGRQVENIHSNMDLKFRFGFKGPFLISALTTDFTFGVTGVSPCS